MLVEREGFSVVAARSLADAEARLGETSFDVVLVDLELPDGNGFAFLAEHEALEHSEVIVITGNASVDSAVSALREGALDYLTKPFDRARLRSCLSNVARTRSLKGEIADLRADLRHLGRFGSMVGSSPAMQSLYDQIAKVAPTSLGVLVSGESGVGKELVAQTLHRLGPRSSKRLVPVNCGAMAPTLVESELFGHERGAFTGADRVRQGCFELAEGGTLFLDEVTEMPVELQVKLLRVLESREVVRVGGSRSIAVDVRVVAATNRDPRRAVEEGALREDLYYRLAVFPMHVPPLRERDGDAPLLAQHFLDGLNAEHGTEKIWSPAALERLDGMDFPGNVRELKNLVSRAYVLGDEVLGADELGAPAPHRALFGGAERDGDSVTVRVGSSIDEVEQVLIEATLEKLDGDKAQAADVLGISLKTLYNRLKVYAAARRARAKGADAPD
ncbi:MAG: sigma-54-dependent Fis family transcriptional regulator [Planctomycetes bacterium]|nr:sigma-54-dependent Fis family transcriptional regulator [Planctomycetota bacterium]